MSNLIKVVAGVVIGILLTVISVWNLMPHMMLHERVSPYGIDKTVETIKSKAVAQGWAVPSVKPLHQSVKKNGGGELPPIMLVNLCNGQHAHSILKNDADKRISVFMPCTISVYEKSDKKTYIGSMNAGLLGGMFGGNVAHVMAEVSEDQQSFISF